ncbi:HGGxSTG domain-containing protein [Croceicoccus bisphenolivorans]|uniref:HGGxSTG domain-containing protein n=1 Tax=Croceicoccus bisphenolivorans TaxID=1783232 RepID=UPI003CCBAA1C
MNGQSNPLPKLLTDAKLCQARTRAGTLCRCPALKGRNRCSRHGGKSTGVSGEANGSWKDGAWSNEAIALRREANKLLRELRNA